MTKTLWRWEQDGSGGINGTATYFVGSVHEVNVPMPNFSTANRVFNCIDETIKAARYDARALLLAQIGRIEP